MSDKTEEQINDEIVEKAKEAANNFISFSNGDTIYEEENVEYSAEARAEDWLANQSFELEIAEQYKETFKDCFIETVKQHQKYADRS